MPGTRQKVKGTEALDGERSVRCQGQAQLGGARAFCPGMWSGLLGQAGVVGVAGGLSALRICRPHPATTGVAQFGLEESRLRL